MSNTVPLFEKLTDEAPEAQFEKVPRRFPTLEEVQNSIREDLTRLLNTRIAILWKNRKDLTPFSYGVNITAPTSAENVFEIQELENSIDKIIKLFEPRLKDVKSKIVRFGNDPRSLFVNINATTEFENQRTPLSFPVVIDS
ncbi:MAG: type VI secretion system baseplate subunit TssE [Holosporaceae bacterium]|jgi:type VI secretion system lysozyme-like protein|nr:type VI secretion system baseplate subunit TssE [Holosporaceae bacterium]